MRAVRWPQDLDGKMKVVELYVVNDYSQVCHRITSVAFFRPVGRGGVLGAYTPK